MYFLIIFDLYFTPKRKRRDLASNTAKTKKNGQKNGTIEQRDARLRSQQMRMSTVKKNNEINQLKNLDTILK